MTGGVHTYIRISEIRRPTPSQPPGRELGSLVSAKSRLAINDAPRAFPPIISSHSSGVGSIPLITNRAAQFTIIPIVHSVSIHFDKPFQIDPRHSNRLPNPGNRSPWLVPARLLCIAGLLGSVPRKVVIPSHTRDRLNLL